MQRDSLTDREPNMKLTLRKSDIGGREMQEGRDMGTHVYV